MYVHESHGSGHTKFNLARLAYVLTKVERGTKETKRAAAGGGRARTGVARSLTIPNRTCSVAAGTQSGVRVSPASRDAAALDHIVPGMRTCDWTFVASCGLIIARKMSTNPVCGHECEEGFALRGHAPEAPCTPCRGPRRWLARCTDPGEAPRQACRRRLSVP